jgi:hypothetical protein
MIGRDLDKLRAARDEARSIGRLLDNTPFQHPRISLPIGEAILAAARLESFLVDAIETAEAELYRGRSKE